MARLICHLFVNCLIIVSSACQLSTVEKVIPNADYEVYSAFLNEFTFYKNAPWEDAIMIFDSTTIGTHDIEPATPWSWVITHLGNQCRHLKDEVRCRKVQDPAWELLFNALKEADTRKSLPLQDKFKIRYPHQLLSMKRLPKLRHGGEDYRMYCSFSLSNIMYNTDGTKVLFFNSFICGGTCGRGELVMMEKINQTWALVDTFRFWIA